MKQSEKTIELLNKIKTRYNGWGEEFPEEFVKEMLVDFTEVYGTDKLTNIVEEHEIYVPTLLIASDETEYAALTLIEGNNPNVVKEIYLFAHDIGLMTADEYQAYLGDWAVDFIPYRYFLYADTTR